MKALLFSEHNDPLYVGEIPTPQPKSEDLLIRVEAVGVNRADLLQRKGHYPPPAGESPILGLEVAGEVVAKGDAVTKFAVGDRVFGLVGGGAYAEYALLDAGLAFHLPEHFSFIEGAAISEAFLTAYESLFILGQLKKGESLLVHAAASGVGLAAIQLAVASGVHVYGTAGSDKKVKALTTYGATAFNYNDAHFLEKLLTQLGEKSINVVLDFIGAKYANLHQKILSIDGRWLLLAAMGGRELALDALTLVTKRLQVRGFNLRLQSLEQKRKIKVRFEQNALPWFLEGGIKPIVDSIYSMTEANAAHDYMASNQNIGKIILTWKDLKR